MTLVTLLAYYAIIIVCECVLILVSILFFIFINSSDTFTPTIANVEIIFRMMVYCSNKDNNFNEYSNYNRILVVLIEL